MTNEILLAGFGGQGILFMGKLLAYFGLYENKEVSWLPSYGPEMRGGTCNCSCLLYTSYDEQHSQRSEDSGIQQLFSAKDNDLCICTHS